MKIVAAEYCSPTATPELVEELFADDQKRGEFMILEKDKYDFIQVGGETAADGFILEYRERGKDGKLYHCPRTVSRNEAEAAFLDYLDGNEGWKSRFAWEEMEGGGFSNRVAGLVLAAVAIAAIAAYAIIRIAAL